MNYWVVSRSSGIYHNEIVFKYNNWDDYNFLTSFDAYYYNQKGDCTSLGTIKIAVNHQETGIHTLTHLRSACGVKEDSFSFCRLPAHFYSFSACCSNLTKERDLKQVFEILEADPMFNQYELKELIETEFIEDKERRKIARNSFKKMSSGHKVVLSILIRCIDKLVEKTIVFLDEPENHLHPPLLASLIRSLSTMLIKRKWIIYNPNFINSINVHLLRFFMKHRYSPLHIINIYHQVPIK